jgi:hypothetical protein
MEMSNYQLVRVTTRVRHAVGYFELGMVEHAVACLDSVDQLGDVGAFRLVVDMLRAEMSHRPESCDHAAQTLEKLASQLPREYSQALWLALSMCYRQAGDEKRAVSSLACARGAKLHLPAEE